MAVRTVRPGPYGARFQISASQCRLIIIAVTAITAGLCVLLLDTRHFAADPTQLRIDDVRLQASLSRPQTGTIRASVIPEAAAVASDELPLLVAQDQLLPSVTNLSGGSDTRASASLTTAESAHLAATATIGVQAVLASSSSSSSSRSTSSTSSSTSSSSKDDSLFPPWGTYDKRAITFPDHHHESSSYITGRIDYDDMADYHRKIQHYLKSPNFQRRVAHLKATGPPLGILINAGGRRLVTNLIVTLKVLREVHNCTLPVEVAWQNAGEMDPVTLANLKERFGPIIGRDLSKEPYPSHQRPKELQRYVGKVYSLLHTSFQKVLMVDADSMPLQDPSSMFSHPQFEASGSLFWPDFWTGIARGEAWSMVGLDAHAAKDVLGHGKMWSGRDSESGQLLLDRTRHLDVLEWAYWINSFEERFTGKLWYDKDTFSIAFAVAGKAHMFAQVSVPPGGIFEWRADKLLIKATHQQVGGWLLIGMLQHDSWGRPAFVHRTINKWTLDDQPSLLEVITAPVTAQWANYYLAHENPGPTRGVPWDYVVPRSSFQVYRLSGGDRGQLSGAKMRGGSVTSHQSSGTCPVPYFKKWWEMRTHALPIDDDSSLLTVDTKGSVSGPCASELRNLLNGSAFQHWQSHGWLFHPQLSHINKDDTEAGYSSHSSDPLPAWEPDWNDPPKGQAINAITASYEARKWLEQNLHLFPILKKNKRLE